jgi:uncharacterized damage-inducible protein DinB
MSEVVGRPEADEYAPFYAGYVSLVPDGDVRALLRSQSPLTQAALHGVTDEQASRGYGPGKWTLKEVLLHMADAERVFSYRLLRIGRGDVTPLPGFEQDMWVMNSGAAARTVASIVAEFAAVRGATLALADSLSAEAWRRRGTASGKPVSARALAYVCAGHELHHLGVIRDRYL